MQNPKVLRSVFLTPEMDNFLQQQAMNLRMDQHELIKRYMISGAKILLEEALNAPPGSPLARSLSKEVLRKARVANLLPSAPAPRKKARAVVAKQPTNKKNAPSEKRSSKST